MRRLLLVLVIIGLTPGTWVRSALPPWNDSQALTITRLQLDQTKFGELEFIGGWHLESPNSGFGSYSALLDMGNDRLLAASDSGGLLEFPRPGTAGTVQIGRFAGRKIRRKNLIDIESLTRDPASGQIWAGYEGTNSIERLDADLKDGWAVQPPAMQEWRSNAGPEAMVRLSDGRFIVLSEGPRSWLGDSYPALLFPSDPVSGALPLEFMFESPDGFAPVDMVEIPDGRVMVLVRSFSLGLPPRFAIRLIVVDPADISKNALWAGRSLGEIGTEDVQDNYEGIAVKPTPKGVLDIWLISDDNSATFQRSLMLNLKWDPVRGKDSGR